MQHVNIAGWVTVIKVQQVLEPYPLLFMPVCGMLLVQPLPQLSHLLLSLLTQYLHQGTRRLFWRTAAACHTIRRSLLLITSSSLVHYGAWLITSCMCLCRGQHARLLKPGYQVLNPCTGKAGQPDLTSSCACT
jgi:hypothetical protein